MNAEIYRRAREVFVRAIETDPSERGAFVEAACGKDVALREEVGTLLAAHEEEHGFQSLGRPARSTAGAPPLEIARLPERIGRYRVLDILGEGGMGVVYLAEQDHPRRTVALKVVHPGLASPTRLRRFEHEAQILGRLHHPGIAQIYEAGAADSGHGTQPYLAMEFVQGRTIVEHAESAGLDVRRRIELLVGVIRAVEYAHGHGVVHRDLKPGNILVDEHGAPRILDFGIARATDDDLRARTLLTGKGEILGTLPYMSPEQLGADAAAIDARADVYALGVIGYELLSGRLPIDVSRKSLAEAALAIREEEPTALGGVRRELRGDLETIFAKALEKDCERRYASAAALADDLERWLREEPIVARRQSTMYQLAKFARRNRVLVGGVAAVFVALVLGIAGTAWQALRATSQRDQARRSEEKAGRQAKRAQASMEFVDRLFGSLDPDRDGRNVTLYEVVRKGESELDEAYAGEPEVEATLRFTLGKAYWGLGLTGSSEKNLRRSLELFRATLGPDDPSTVTAEALLGEKLADKRKYDEAEPLLQHALEVSRRTDGPDSAAALFVEGVQAATLGHQGKLDEAAAAHEALLERARRSLGDEHTMTLDILAGLAGLRLDQGRVVESYEAFREAVELSRRLRGEEHSTTLACAHGLANTLVDQGEYPEARSIYEQILEVMRRRSGEVQTDTLAVWNNLAALLDDMGEWDRAGEIYAELLVKMRKHYGSANPKTLTVVSNLAVLRQEQGRYDEAEALFREGIEEAKAKGTYDVRAVISLRGRLADLLEDEQRWFEADEQRREVLNLVEHAIPDGNWNRGAHLGSYGGFLVRQGCFEQAIPYLEDAQDRLEAAFGPGGERTVKVKRNLMRAYEGSGRAAEAAAIKEELAAVAPGS